jgi:hypothetical protein
MTLFLDVFEWCTTATRLTVAFTAIALTTLDVNSDKPIIHEFADKWYSQSRIWRLAIDAWVYVLEFTLRLISY